MAPLRYDASTDMLSINDDLKKSQRFMYLTLILVLPVFLAPLYDHRSEPWGLFMYLRLALCLVIVGVILYSWLRTTAAASIPAGDIEALRVRKIFGRDVYSLWLSNGKRRPLQRVSTDAGRNQLYRVLRDAQVATFPVDRL